MFWDTKDPPSHNIEILLESPDTKVEVFLDEDNIIQECKTHKKNIVNYFTRPDVIRRLIELITTEPPEEVPLSERFRHANVACEILTMGLPSLDEKLLANTDTLNMLYSYLENEPPLNPLLASFFSKTFSMLFTKKSDQDWFLYQQMCLTLLEYLKAKSNFLDLICKHFATPSVPDLIMEMLHSVEGAQLKKSLYEWLNEERLVEKLIEIIDDPEQSEKHANVADFLCDLIHQGRIMRQDTDTFEPAFEGSNPILKNIESATTLFALFNVILQPNAVESAIVSGITVVLKIIKPVKVTDERNIDRLIAFLDREKKIHDEFLTTVIRAIEPQLKHFNELLKNPPKKHDILTSAANLSPPFGKTRLQICRLFTELLEIKNEEISKAICETDFLNTLLSLFKEYCWNNFLHSEVEKCLHIIFPHAAASNVNANNNSKQVSDSSSKDSEDKKNTKDLDDLNSILDSFSFDVSFLLPLVEGTTKSVESSPSAIQTHSVESSPSAIQTHAVVNCKIISKLIECWKTNKEIECAEKGRRLGYMGHLINIFKHITQCISESQHVGALIESNLQDDNERNLWQSIVNSTDGDLTKALSTQSKLLANYEPCDYNVSLDFFTGNDISDEFNGLCTVMDSSDAFGPSNDDDEGDEDDGGLSFYVHQDVNPFKDDPWLDEDSQNLFATALSEMTDLEKNGPFANFQLNFLSKSSSVNSTEATPTDTVAAGDAVVPMSAPSSEEYDNNANVEKSSSPWSGGDFTSFQIPKKDTQYTSNFVDDYDDDEGMWTKPLGVSQSTTTVDQSVAKSETKSETQFVEPINQTTDECNINTMTNGPSLRILDEDIEHVPEESSSLNQLNNSIEDNTLVDQKVEDITTSENKDTTIKEINTDLKLNQEEEKTEETQEEIITSKHKSSMLDTNKIENTDTTNNTTSTCNHLNNTATSNEYISDDSNTATTT